MQHQQKTTTIQVPPSRLAMGEWCHQSNTSIGEGDIYGAYSADKIALEGKIRKPFRLKGWLYTATSVAGSVDFMMATAYRLMPPAHVDLQLRTYADLRLNTNRENGFYHGLSVEHGGEQYILVGPPVEICKSDEPELVQASLF